MNYFLEKILSDAAVPRHVFLEQEDDDEFDPGGNHAQVINKIAKDNNVRDFGEVDGKMSYFFRGERNAEDFVRQVLMSRLNQEDIEGPDLVDNVFVVLITL